MDISIRSIKYDKTVLPRVAGLYLDTQFADPDSDFSFVEKAFAGSYEVLGAFDENNLLIGMARAISDGASDAYIQDVMVASTHRKMGVGKKLVTSLTKQLRANGIDWIGIVGVPGSEKFYSSCKCQFQEGYSLWFPGEDE
jgi:spermidine synthase